MYNFGHLVPSSWPENIHAVNTSSTSIEIRWDPIPLSKTHGILEGYHIFLRKANESEWEVMYNVTAIDVINHIENLWKYTKYLFSIAGFTSVGTGVACPELSVWTDEDGKCEN